MGHFRWERKWAVNLFGKLYEQWGEWTEDYFCTHTENYVQTKFGQSSSHDICSRTWCFHLPGLQQGHCPLILFDIWVSVWKSHVSRRFCGPGWSRKTYSPREDNLTHGHAGGSSPFSILSVPYQGVSFLLQLCTHCKKGSATLLSNTRSLERLGPVWPHPAPRCL